MEGKLHVYYPKKSLLLFEFTPKYTPGQTDSTSPPSSSTPLLSTPKNTLLFVGGLYDNFLNPGYTTDLARLFPRHSTQAWRLMHVQLSSHGKSFGVSDINHDIDEIATAIHYIRNDLSQNRHQDDTSTLKPQTPDTSSSPSSSTVTSNIVLMGHSTGCQDTLHYLSNPSNPTLLTSNKPSSTPKPSTTTRPPIQGAILQAPASDRESSVHTSIDTLTTIQSLIKSTPESERRSTILPTHLTTPQMGPAPLSISRYLSLTSPESPDHPSEEDMFSSDLPDQHIKASFGNIGKVGLLKPPSPSSSTSSILILMSSNDEYIPTSINKKSLMERWSRVMTDANTNNEASVPVTVTINPLSTIIPHANHAIDDNNNTTKDIKHSRKARLQILRTTVLKYLDEVVGDVDRTAWGVLERESEEFGLGNDDDDDGNQVEKGIGGVKL